MIIWIFMFIVRLVQQISYRWQPGLGNSTWPCMAPHERRWFDTLFFEQLTRCPHKYSLGWLAPSLYTWKVLRVMHLHSWVIQIRQFMKINPGFWTSQPISITAIITNMAMITSMAQIGQISWMVDEMWPASPYFLFLWTWLWCFWSAPLARIYTAYHLWQKQAMPCPTHSVTF